ncbi:ABC transporter [Streptomyces sp. TRM 70361]|uniref:ABC transporter n=1 Tax=Streptomyces sp. TRM 70361 TaxID=3116553 RepID=UPI002E7B34AC|nr:ABC transporter [Streptomyces sp. TRM 70361]MEE1941880.1 ABC transporter [Streptomyces sp. TRM 70361]
MSTLTQPPAAPADSGTSASRRGPRLRGMTWLVWRQHRAAFWTVLALTAVGAAWMVYQRGQMVDQLQGFGWPGELQEGWFEEFDGGPLNQMGFGLAVAHLLTGVFLGAPLFAGDLESGTAKLVLSQSAGRTRWLVMKLAMTGAAVVAAAAALSSLYGWWLSPVEKESTVVDWTSQMYFDSSGPVLVGLTLFTTVTGAAIGLLVRRVLASMVVTFGAGLAVMTVWNRYRLELGSPVRVTTEQGVGEDAPYPELPEGAHELDVSHLTASGETVGWGTCNLETEQKSQACLEKNEVVGWAIDYLPHSQMATVQWTGAAILFALSAAVAAFIVIRGRTYVP